MKKDKGANSLSPRCKPLILAISIVLLVCVGVGATWAYFAMSATPVINTFQSGSVGAEVVEQVNGSAKTSITVKNTGESPVYVRVRLVSYFEDAYGNVLPQSSQDVSFTPGENWTQIGEYYYHRLPIAAGTSTTNLLGTSVSMASGQVIEVLADTVQAAPAQAVEETWGISPSSFTG